MESVWSLRRTTQLARDPLIDLLLVQNCLYSADVFHAQQAIKSDLKSSKRAALHDKATSLLESLPEGLRLADLWSAASRPHGLRVGHLGCCEVLESSELLTLGRGMILSCQGKC